MIRQEYIGQVVKAVHTLTWLIKVSVIRVIMILTGQQVIGIRLTFIVLLLVQLVHYLTLLRVEHINLIVRLKISGT